MPGGGTVIGADLKKIPQKIVDALLAKLKDTQSAGGGDVAGGPGGTNAQNQKLGQKMAAEKGWTGAEWTALNQVVMMESGWSSTVKNPTSSASGIAQNISGFPELPER